MNAPNGGFKTNLRLLTLKLKNKRSQGQKGRDVMGNKLKNIAMIIALGVSTPAFGHEGFNNEQRVDYIQCGHARVIVGYKLLRKPDEVQEWLDKGWKLYGFTFASHANLSSRQAVIKCADEK